MLYYKSGNSYKKTIGNYILEGNWRTDYLELQQSASAGEEELKNHIKNSLDNGEHTAFKLG